MAAAKRQSSRGKASTEKRKAKADPKRGRAKARLAAKLKSSRSLKAAASKAAASRRRQPPKASAGQGRSSKEEEDEEATDDEDSDAEEREAIEDRRRAEDDEREHQRIMKLLDSVGKSAPHLTSSAKTVPYNLVIPTYGRWKPVGEMTLKKRFKSSRTPFILKHTLGFLSRQGIPRKKVTLFVANAQEKEHYRRALQGSEWKDVRIELSVLGNKDGRNFIYKFFPAGTYVVSLDDDVERIQWKFRDGITHHTLANLPPGGLETIIFDAYQRMKQKKAFLWGVNTSQNPRHMSPEGVSTKLGLVNGYLNGFICRPQLASQLLRTLTDATEDSEFSVRHWAKDGIVLRYRMYAGVTSPYLNRGGLQTKFEKSGERISAEERGAVRKAEERKGAQSLHEMFPRLIGPPRPRRDRKTMEVTFYPNGYPTGEGQKRKMWVPNLRDDDRLQYAPNPKIVGTVSWKLYEKYKKSATVAEARKNGARQIDFAFDSNWGYLMVTQLSKTPESRECEVRDDGSSLPSSAGKRWKKTEEPVVAKGSSKSVMVRTKEMSEGHKGMAISRLLLARLASRCPALQEMEDDDWSDLESPLSQVYLRVLRVLLHWGSSGRLLYPRKLTKGVHDALKLCGAKSAAQGVKRLEARELKAEEAEKASKAKQAALRKKAPRRGGGEGSSRRRSSRSGKKSTKHMNAVKMTKKARALVQKKLKAKQSKQKASRRR
eukprot:TRINITY_DN41951_c0_g1_i1.p1 TRINITY_DN41951_c0_g1~~TRINITY_DN41951_c0_g1_i1.p1  ORF type:complete len:714 (-),score=195.17 TRINITY_DN41951_c0_g1_i1:81-2222(-)